MVNSPWPAWPGRCLLCGLDSGRARDLCRPCAAELAPLGPHCVRCALPLATPGLCGRCLLNPPAFEAAHAALRYDFHAAALVRALKHRGQRACARLLGELLAEALPLGASAGIDALVPLPLHWWRRARRGFNQAALIAEVVARHHALPLRPRLLTRTRHTPPQQQLDAGARSRNLRGAFRAHPDCRGLRLALVDDVITTGASATAAAAALKEGGAQRVEVWCAARTP